MALGFFRRRQKMVIIIMVALMVSFLVGSYGVNMILSTNPRDREVGKTRAGEIVQGDLWSAQADLDVLASIGLGNRYRYPPWPTDMTYLSLSQNGNRAHQAYALLLAEAKHAGISVGEVDVDAFFARIGRVGQRYQHLISSLRAANETWTEGAVRHTVRNWLMINKSFTEADVRTPPSEAEARLGFRDLTEQIGLRVMRLPAEDYLDKVTEPNQAEIDRHFNLYRTRLPDQTRKVADLGFGYRQPGRAAVQYLVIRGDVLRRITEPQFDAVVDYYNQNKGEFVKKVPIGPAATSPAADPNAAGRPTKDVPMTFAEAKEQIVDKLRDDTLKIRLEEVAGQVEGAVRRFLQSGGDPNEAYARARQALIRPADKPLGTVLGGVKIDNLPLKDAVARLAQAAKLQGICYPWGTHGANTLLPTVKVSLQADGITLREALDQISVQVKWPKLRWALCDVVRDVLFSVETGGEGVDFFCVSVGKTPLWTRAEITEDEVLGFAYASPAGGNTLAEIVWTAKGLAERPQQTPMIEPGAQGSRMYLMGDKPGRLLWRLVDVSAAHVPGDLDDFPDLRKRVLADVKLQRAFQQAVRAGNKMKNAASAVGLETVASVQKKETVTTGLFSRRTPDMNWANVPALGLTSPEQQAFVLQEAFKLTPENVEPNAPAGPPAIGVVPLPIKKEVLVLERADFRPTIGPEYEDLGRLATVRYLAFRRYQLTQAAWFNLKVILRRLEFTR